MTIRSPIPARPGEGLAAAAAGLSEPRHLGEPARDDRRLRVVAELEPVDPAGGQRDHVLRRRRELDADEVLVDVDPEDERVELVLELARQLHVLARDDGGRRQAVPDLLGEVRARRDGDRRSLEERREPVAGLRVEPFVRLSTGPLSGRPATTSPKARLGTASTTRSAPSNGASSSVGAADTLQLDVRQVLRVPCVGMQAHGSEVATVAQQFTGLLPDAIAKPLMPKAGVDRLAALYTAIDIVRRGGTISLIGVYGGMADPCRC